MITKLTIEQKNKLKEYKEKYIKIGLSTDRINRGMCIKDVNNFYVSILKREKSRKVIFCQSPYQLWKMICFFKFSVKIILNKIKNKKINIKKIKKDISNEVENEVRNEVRNEVWNEVSNEVRKNNLLISFFSSYLWGSFDATYFSFYNYFLNELKINYKCKEKYMLYEKLLSYGYIYSLKNICFVSEKPIKIKKQNKRLHADIESALEYADGFSLYRLHGVSVPKWLVMTSADKLDVNKIMAIENVEVRKEAIQKIGLTNLMKKLNGKVLSKMNIYVDKNQKVYLKNKEGLNKISYELIEVDLKLATKTKMLKMKNPSLEDVYHYEYVSPDCKTVKDALKFRNGVEELPIYLS